MHSSTMACRRQGLMQQGGAPLPQRGLLHRRQQQQRQRRPPCAARRSSTVAHSVAAPARVQQQQQLHQQPEHKQQQQQPTTKQQQQKPWQHALLDAMAESHLADRAGSSSSTAQQRHQDVDALLDACYDALDQEVFFSKGGFVIPPAERQEIDATGGSASYGEILGVQQLLWCLGPMDSGSSVFVDLGSGRGRCVLQVAAHSDAAACIGLELSDSRLEQAELALQQLQQQAAGGLRLRPVQFRRADLGTCSLEEGTHFYMCSTAFGSAICRSIAQRLSQSANFQVLVTSRQLPSQPFLMLAGEVPCGFTYSANGRAYVYVKSLAAAPPGVLARLWCRDGVCWLPGMRDAQMAIAEPEPLDSGDAAARYVQLSSELLHGTD